MEMLDDELEDVVLPPGFTVVLAPIISGNLFIRVVNYPVIVEAWDKRKAGRARREYVATFTESQRDTIARYYKKFHDWYLVRGTPQKVMIRPGTIELLQRAVAFFASI